MTDFSKIDPTSVWGMTKQSLKDHLGKASSTRINGYIMTILFAICVFCVVGVEITSTGVYTVSNQLIAICVLILGQQALLFNLKRKSEDTSYPTVENLNNVLNNNDKTPKINISDILPSGVDVNKEQQDNMDNSGEIK